MAYGAAFSAGTRSSVMKQDKGSTARWRRGWRADAAVVGAVVFSASAASAAMQPTDPSQAGIETGRYLAAAAHCSACHTSRADRPFAGNVAIPSKFGTMYSSNITPDRATGIGDWSEAEFTSALRQGRGRHGEYLYPSMPYTDFTKISDADAHALWLYFRSVAPIAEKQKPNAMKFPFNVRPGIAAWQAVYFRPGRFVPDATQSQAWNRGAYLVQGLGHCGACHTPKNFAMADKKDQALQGAATGDFWFAPDIGGGRFSGINDWSVDQVVAYLRTGHNDKNVAAVGPMLQTIAKGTSELSAGDLQAIALYLKNQTTTEPVHDASPRTLSADRRTAGEAIYVSNCATCHGESGRGVDGIAPALAGNSAVTSAGPENAMHAVLSGFAPSGRWGAMPSFAETLDTQQIADVSNYIRVAWGGQAPANATTSAVNRMRHRVEIGDPRIQAALVCPNVPTTAIDAETRTRVDALAKKPDGADVPAAQLVRDYRKRHPDVERGEVVNVLSGAYCRSLMSSGTGSNVDRQGRVIRFSAGVAAVVAR